MWDNYSMLTILALAASAPVCTKLQADFKENERAFTIAYRLAKINDEIDDARRELRTPSGYARHPSWENRERIEKKYKDEGDRITNLLVANKCTPPDHVTSQYTYEAELFPPKGTPDSGNAREVKPARPTNKSSN